MNDSRDPRTKLLAETLDGDWAEGPAAAMARGAAAHARRRRVVRRTSLVLTAAAALAVVIFTGKLTHAPAPLVQVAAVHRGYEIISDDELVALLRDRPLLVLPQANGAKKFVVLDR